MNEIFRRPIFEPCGMPTTQAAEGLPRYRWTVEQIEKLTEIGVFADSDRFELIGGEIVPMSPKGNRHEWMKTLLNEHFMAKRPADVFIVPETTFRITPDTYVEPDFCVFPRAGGIAGLTAVSCLLAVEVSDSSLSYDMGRKARVYASFGVREMWVVNARTLVTRVHLEPAPEGYQRTLDMAYTELITPQLIPALAVRLADLDLEPLSDV